MSFDKDLRGTGDIRNLFQRIKRRILKSELPEDIDQNTAHGVNKIMTQIDFMNSYDINNNPSSVLGVGPHEFVSEPDATEVMIYNTFANKYGSGLKETKTLDGVNYDVIEIGDSTNIRSTASAPYHYEGYKKFNGVSDFLNVPNSTALQLNQFSIACWYRTVKHRLPIPVGVGEGFIMSKGGWLSGTAGQNLSYGMWMSDADRVRAGFEEGDSTDHIASAPFDRDWIDGVWRHMVCTYDKVTVRLYADGVEVATHATTTDPEVNTQAFTVGRQGLQGPNNTPLFYEGDLDEIYVWNNDLTSGEVSALYSAGTIPQVNNLVYRNNFDQSGDGKTQKKCYYAVPQGANNWGWRTPPNPTAQLPTQIFGAIDLNVGSNSGQFLYYDEFGTDLDFTGASDNFSFGLWIYPTDLTTDTGDRIVVFRDVDSSNEWAILIDSADNKLWVYVEDAGVSTKRQYDTALTANTWYYINITWVNTGPTLSLKVNDNADTSSTKSDQTDSTELNALYFGFAPNQSGPLNFKGYILFPHYYKHSTILTTAERTSLYNYGTRTSTTKPFIIGLSEFG